MYHNLPSTIHYATKHKKIFKNLPVQSEKVKKFRNNNRKVV